MIQGTGTRYCNIAKLVEVRRVVLVRAVAPAVPVAVLPGIQGHLIVVEEIRRTCPGALCKAGFYGNGVAFGKAARQIKLEERWIPRLADEI